MVERLQEQRRAAWRLLDTAGGAALGALLTLALGALINGAAPATPAAAVTPAPALVSSGWTAGPWAGCALVYVSQSPLVSDAGVRSAEVSANWVCSHGLPPSFQLTPTPTTPAAR